MCRFASNALLLALALALAAGCGDRTPEASFVSEAVAAPANGPDYGWRTGISPAAGDGAVAEYY